MTALLEEPPKRDRYRIQVLDSTYGPIEIPRIDSLDDFLEWRHSDSLPDKLKVHYLNGLVCVEAWMEEFDSHNLVKGAVSACLTYLLDDTQAGRFGSDGMLFSNEAAELGTEPDGMIVLNQSRLDGRIVFKAGKRRGAKATILTGTPDMVLEVISPSSTGKDFDRLMKLYFEAGIPEYWLIDARNIPGRLTIHRRSQSEYQAQPRNEEWVLSPLLNREFHFQDGLDQNGFYYCRLLSRKLPA